ncbi:MULTISPECIES: hypothetical protein [Acinetobacter]|jgi:hypothetical protein|uniref:hypothetical protein n=1 Tax=Acinetobacter TaxID=469 RepID=UPI000CECA511|nr:MULTISPECIES: hypothetical protein [Acinetobacter]
MNQERIIQLIEAGQSLLKHELQLKHPESKYSLLMLQRSFQILKNYIESQSEQEQKQLDIYQNYFHFPITNAVQSADQLCVEMRENFDMQALAVLEQLNQLELEIIKAG